ncbi:MAG: UPF0280 family protein [Bacillota bacterium]
MANPNSASTSVNRSYRRELCPPGMRSFTLVVKETDLWVAVDEAACISDLVGGLENYIWRQRTFLENYLEQDANFRKALTPYLTQPGAPELAVRMTRAANRAGVGPMAAVAGAFAQLAGEWLLNRTSQVIVENGGDIFFCCRQAVSIGVYAGASPFSNRLVIEVDAPGQRRGICTSSATVGPSYSMGQADAAVIFGVDTLLADAVATAAANMVRTQEDLEKALQFAMGIEGVEGALVILNDKLAACGNIQLRQRLVADK